ncbi:hypothetical protein EZS27_034810 [termite gut metagenome]|uniref:Type I restriction modification DNA specificity domain-containing protein n=1 Tax=termite gut metagenome TaxID=433724 RepID=A0A5J4Q0M6_9ZZZZ
MIETDTYISKIINERLDAQFFNSKFISLTDRIRTNPHKPLYKLVGFSNESWNQKDFFEDYFPYIEISAIDIQTGVITEIINVEKVNAPSRAKKVVRNNDILVSTTRPNRGAISLVKNVEDVYIASTGFAVIRNIKEDILRDYLFIVLKLKISLDQMGQRSSGGNYPAITEDELKKILIPLPPKEIQQKIVDLYQQAQQTKQAKKQEAKTLLDGIDDYLLKELGIELSENVGNEKCFEVSFLELLGNRLDPIPYNTRFTSLRELIKTNPLKKLYLKDLIIHSVTGDWGIEEDEITDDYMKRLVIRSTEFDNRYNLRLDNSRVKYRKIRIEKLTKMDIQPNDLLIEKSGGSPDQPVGRIAFLSTDIIDNNTLCYSNFIHKIRVDK